VDQQDHLYATDQNDAAIQEFSPACKLLKRFFIPGLPGRLLPIPGGIAVDRRNNIYLSDTRHDRVLKLSPTGTTLWELGKGQFNQPSGIALDAQGALYVCDRKNSRIHKFSPAGRELKTWGSYGNLPNQFGEPEGIAVSPSGTVYVSDYDFGRIEEFTQSGQYITQF
jgi:DNA-binding beta-propeller fold protein YncE